MTPALDLESLKAFWAEQAEKLAWFKHWDKTLEWNEPYAKWFEGGTLNASYNCVDVHIKAGRGEHVAINWESENGSTKTWTYQNLYDRMNAYAKVFQDLGMKKGDLVVLYLPMIPETIAAMLAVVRLGATHSVVFSGFSHYLIRYYHGLFSDQRQY